MKTRKNAKSTAMKSNVANTSISKATRSEDPVLSVESKTIDITVSFGSEKQRKVFPPRIVEMCRMDMHNDRIHVVSNVLLPEECEYFIKWGEEHGFEEFKQAQSREYAHRENGRIQTDDPILAQRIYERISPFLPTEIDRLNPRGCSSNIRLYRYTPGQSFGKHIDEAHTDDYLKGVTKYTLLIYLSGHPSSSDRKASDDATECQDPECGISVPSVTCTGGETVFYKGHSSNQVLLSVSPEQGKLLLHGHGVKCLTHEGSAVTSGVKYVLRTDVVYPQWNLKTN